ncbi:NAD(P)-binding protein [Vibrio lentus]|uniref:FAD-dependent oxidoreductase n=1 Tax=Vibrio lentus TaxID=136468 RepID=A0A2N7KC35_9VIBR|nr:NAD(P)-binding protein [Vibrio lentus]PMM72877.1 FAD-dependent oxidoreductase [Vibrio lentus]
MTCHYVNESESEVGVSTGPTRPKVAIFGAGISGLAVAHNCVKQGFDVAVYDKELYTGGKCVGTVDEGGVVHELTHRQFFAKNYNLINFLKEVPRESGNCLDSLYPQNMVQFSWAQNNKTIQFQRGYFSRFEKLWDNAKSAYSMLYAQVPIKDTLWFKQRLQKPYSMEELLGVPVSEFFAYESRPGLADFLRSVLLGWIGATDDTPALAILDLLNNKDGELHASAPDAYSLGMKEPISDALINPLTHHLKKQGVQFHLGYKAKAICPNKKRTRIDSVLLHNDCRVLADYYVFALPAHVIKSLFSEISSVLNYEYVLSHGFQFYFSQVPSVLKNRTVGLVLDSPWGLSYHVTTRSTSQGDTTCLSVTATELNNAIGLLYKKPMLSCTEEQVKDELLFQLFGQLDLLEHSAYQGFRVGLGAKMVTPQELETLYSDYFYGDMVTNESGQPRYWVLQHALTQPTAQNSLSTTMNNFSNVFFSGEYLSDPRQTWRVPVTLERCIETANLCAVDLVERVSSEREERR